ncbi:MAG: hypothetical protein WCG83_04755 [Candidatus Peregrinibacteria bacterium]
MKYHLTAGGQQLENALRNAPSNPLVDQIQQIVAQATNALTVIRTGQPGNRYSAENFVQVVNDGLDQLTANGRGNAQREGEGEQDPASDVPQVTDPSTETEKTPPPATRPKEKSLVKNKDLPLPNPNVVSQESLDTLLQCTDPRELACTFLATAQMEVGSWPNHRSEKKTFDLQRMHNAGEIPAGKETAKFIPRLMLRAVNITAQSNEEFSRQFHEDQISESDGQACVAKCCNRLTDEVLNDSSCPPLFNDQNRQIVLFGCGLALQHLNLCIQKLQKRPLSLDGHPLSAFLYTLARDIPQLATGWAQSLDAVASHGAGKNGKAWSNQVTSKGEEMTPERQAALRALALKQELSLTIPSILSAQSERLALESTAQAIQTLSQNLPPVVDPLSLRETVRAVPQIPYVMQQGKTEIHSSTRHRNVHISPGDPGTCPGIQIDHAGTIAVINIPPPWVTPPSALYAQQFGTIASRVPHLAAFVRESLDVVCPNLLEHPEFLQSSTVIFAEDGIHIISAHSDWGWVTSPHKEHTADETLALCARIGQPFTTMSTRSITLPSLQHFQKNLRVQPLAIPLFSGITGTTADGNAPIKRPGARTQKSENEPAQPRQYRALHAAINAFTRDGRDPLIYRFRTPDAFTKGTESPSSEPSQTQNLSTLTAEDLTVGTGNIVVIDDPKAHVRMIFQPETTNVVHVVTIPESKNGVADCQNAHSLGEYLRNHPNFKIYMENGRQFMKVVSHVREGHALYLDQQQRYPSPKDFVDAFDAPLREALQAFADAGAPTRDGLVRSPKTMGLGHVRSIESGDVIIRCGGAFLENCARKMGIRSDRRKIIPTGEQRGFSRDQAQEFALELLQFHLYRTPLRKYEGVQIPTSLAEIKCPEGS